MPLTTQHFSICCKSQILGTHLEELLWQTPKYVSLLRRRRTHLPVLLLSCNLHLHPHSLPPSHCFLLPSTPFRSLLRPHTSSLSPAMSSLTTHRRNLILPQQLKPMGL